MIKLALKREDYWLDLGYDVRVNVAPLSTALVMAARSAAAAKIQSTDEAVGTRAAGFLTELAQVAFIAWEGVCDENGEPAAFTDENVHALMQLWPIADAFERLYLPPSLLLEQEKNG
jgi:hypothetical protein